MIFSVFYSRKSFIQISLLLQSLRYILQTTEVLHVLMAYQSNLFMVVGALEWNQQTTYN